ncbi:hypothetical protein IQ255_25315 [Pleurocapsales cyanobacterium LEGE 10410]|nr:hypothetical protein [Pleurocapsales cyanobacterium LEGE 10410]
MATFRRFIKALKDYYQQGEVGDIAYLKIELLRIGGSPELLTKLEGLENYYPTIYLEALAQLPEGTLGYEYAQHSDLAPRKIDVLSYG